MLAFEAGIADHVIVRDNVFVGVHLNENTFEVFESYEPWSCGYVR